MIKKAYGMVMTAFVALVSCSTNESFYPATSVTASVTINGSEFHVIYYLDDISRTGECNAGPMIIYAPPLAGRVKLGRRSEGQWFFQFDNLMTDIQDNVVLYIEDEGKYTILSSSWSVDIVSTEMQLQKFLGKVLDTD